MSRFDPIGEFLDDQVDWLAEIKIGTDHGLVAAWQVGKCDDLFAQVYVAHFLGGREKVERKLKHAKKFVY